MGMETVNQAQEAQRVPDRINPRRNTLRHIVIKLTKIKDRDKMLKATREKWQITYKGTLLRLSADFLTETLQARGKGVVYLKWWKGRSGNQEYPTKQDSPSVLIEKSKTFQTKVKRIQQHQTSFSTNAKGTSLGRKHKKRKRFTENKLQAIKKTVIESHILIIILNVNELNVPTKRHSLTGWMRTRAYMHFHLPHHSAWPPPPNCM